MPFFSIIVPIYRVQSYLRQCVDSVLAQPDRDFELILVDDGSPDDCPAICDAYALQHENVTVIHKENGGLSDARNAGIRAARGSYLLFLDGDDFIAEDSLSRMADAIRGDGCPDVLFLNAVAYFEDGETKPYGYGFQRDQFYQKDQEAVLARLSSGGQFHVSASLKAVKRSLMEQADLFFTKGIVGEDVDFSIRLYLTAETYSHWDGDYYRYRQDRAGSIMAQGGGKRFRDLLWIVETWAARSEGESGTRRGWVLRFLFHQYYILLLLYRDLERTAKTRETRAALRRYRYLLRYTENRKARLLYALSKLMGINALSRLIHLYER